MFDGLARVSLAQAHVGRSEYMQAAAYSQEALRQVDRIGYQRGSALANYNLGITLIKLEQRHLAREHLQRALFDPTALRSQEADRARMALATLDGIAPAAALEHSARAGVHGISDL